MGLLNIRGRSSLICALSHSQSLGALPKLHRPAVMKIALPEARGKTDRWFDLLINGLL